MQMAGLFSPSLGTGQGHTTTNSLNIFMFSNIIYIYTYIYIYMLSFCFGSEDVLVPTASTQAVGLARNALEVAAVNQGFLNVLQFIFESCNQFLSMVHRGGIWVDAADAKVVVVNGYKAIETY